jgi:16S rRNA processing protein RimM
MSTASKPPHFIVMAQIGRAHGLKGEVHAVSFTADPLALTDYGELSDAKGRLFKITALRPQGHGQGHGLVLRFAGVTTREAAEALNGVELMLPRGALPDTGDEDDFYHADLIGLEAVTHDGTILGHILAVHNFGAGDMLELRLSADHSAGHTAGHTAGHSAGKSVFVPFIKAAVPRVSLETGTVTIDPEAAGLLSDEAPEPGEDTQ